MEPLVRWLSLDHPPPAGRMEDELLPSCVCVYLDVVLYDQLRSSVRCFLWMGRDLSMICTPRHQLAGLGLP